MILHPIQIDDRESDPQKISALLTERHVPNRITRLPDNGGGDFRWVVEPQDDGDPWLSVVVERKTPADLSASAEDGRLSAFTSTPTTEGAVRALLLHGAVATSRKYNNKPDISVEAVDNLLASVQLDGIIVLHALDSPEGLADRLTSFWHWTGKSNHGSYHRPDVPTTQQVYFSEKERNAVRNLMTIPGWGEKRARDVYRHFDSDLAAIYHMILDEELSMMLTQVPGIAKGTVTSARRFLLGDV